VGFYRASGHLKLAGNLGIVATLQQQFHNLLFARTQTNRLLTHLPSKSFPAFVPAFD